MYLKKMIASGFKSFADKIIIDYTNGITGIVGPNGSGKSNVVDAVRWVLGEQSVKSLRGEGNMTDVIFSGSKSRNPMNIASVTLVFDNQDHYLPIDFDEVSIRRRVYHDGTNEYSINNEKCRLKDISDLLMDTGMAKESFNIISQGKIEEIISSKPEMRRTIFEEAAGVLKYKKRKTEALHKLERTHDNMERVEDIITEIKEQLTPLKKQHDEALIYQERTKALEAVEVALMATDLTHMNFKYQNHRKKIDALSQEIISITTENSSQEAKIEEYKSEIHKLDQVSITLQKNILDQTTLVEKINSEKNILLERKKYEVEDQKLHNNLLSLKDSQLKLESDFHTLQNEIVQKKTEWNEVKPDALQLEKQYQTLKEDRRGIEAKLTNILRNKSTLEYQIRSLQESIETSSALPYAVRSILESLKLRGIHNAIGNLIEVDEKYATAMTTSLGYASSYVVVDNEICAKEAIQYLKQNKIGRVTFFPLNIIRPKFVESSILSQLTKLEGFIGIASDLVHYDQKYETIIKNQLGNVLVVTDIEHANQISKQIEYRYKIVTLDGELLHIGGSLTGGNSKPTKNVITEKYELEHHQKELEQTLLDIKELENQINEMDQLIRNQEDTLYLKNKQILMMEDSITQQEAKAQELNQQLRHISQEIKGTNQILENSLSEEEEHILKNYYEAVENLKKLELELETVRKKKEQLSSLLEEFEFTLKRENSNFHAKSTELKELEIEVNRLDVKMDTLLSKLNETYHLTYEKAISTYELSIEEEEARNQVASLKKEIQSLGVVNLGAIEEYERINTRYEFLTKQREDLLHAENVLLEIIEEMDSIMKKEFEDTFHIIQQNFTKTFQELFRGGTATLKLTDPNNLLETGVEIIASPPGKKLSSISLLSGGEKTFTAISLLFAILKSRPVPFCILDEVEAALDEVNVDSFGEYLLGLKQKTQFILITHKKRTMEYADVLYGITMQESGVSKLVSVKLEDLK